MPEISAIWVIYAAIALAAILFAEGIFLLFTSRNDERETLNRRMRLQSQKLSQEQVLIQLRKERGLEGSSAFMPSEILRKLRAQSGMTMPLPRFASITTLISAGAGFAIYWFGPGLLPGLIGFLFLTVVLPVQTLRFLRKRRHSRFGLQLPEALELITRSLKAGHPVPVAIAMVSREMPDPIGSEFGMVADEVTYGSDLVSALNAMFHRVGHEDLPLFVTAVSIQSSTGGNLREILDGLSATIRERGKLRRKVRAISTEGRLSAYILTAVPALFAAAITLFTPSFYGEVLDESLTWFLIGGALTLLAIGNAIMFKMATFKY
ncbi:MAG: type II secretion system F family protein [Phyllobacteriaceae bacterium]|nr:type II secretion system F family protein [Phyllobacteriaceae bacterium]